MWALSKDVIAILLVIYLFSQVILPSFIPGMEYFNLHKKRKPIIKTPGVSLDDLDAEATEASQKMRVVKDKISTTEQKVDEIKTKLN